MSDTFDLALYKRLIWRAAGGDWLNGKPVNGNRQLILNAQTNVNWKHDAFDHSPYIWNKLLLEVKRLKQTPIPSIAQDRATTEREVLESKYQPPPEVTHDYKDRYRAAHKMNFQRETPAAYKDGFYCQPTMPKVNTSNGLTTYIVNFILWNGYRATRVNVSGRLIEAPQRQASGVILGTKKYMHSATRKGSADVSSTIPINGVGASVMWEIKIGQDRPSLHQLKEQAREERAGGRYFFVKTVNQFLTIFDELVYGS